mgnify:CR=1
MLGSSPSMTKVAIIKLIDSNEKCALILINACLKTHYIRFQTGIY